MGRSAPQRMSRFSLEATFEQFWSEHVNAARAPDTDDELVALPPRAPASV